MSSEQTAYPAQNSIELTLTAKGLYTWTLKFYCHQDEASVQAALRNIECIDKLLKERYPHPEAGSGQ